MKQSTKDFIKWCLIYSTAFSILTALFDYFQGKSLFILKNIFSGIAFGLVMSYLKSKSIKKRLTNNPFIIF